MNAPVTPPASRPPRRTPMLRLGFLAGWLVGIGLITALIAYNGVDDIVAALNSVGVGALAFGLVHVGTIMLDSRGWRTILSGQGRTGFAGLLLKRWIGMSVNSLLPVAQVGGEFVRARLLAKAGVAGDLAGASVVVDLTIGLLTQAGFAMIGIVMLLIHAGGFDRMNNLVTGIALFGGLILLFGLVQNRGLFWPLASRLQRMLGSKALAGLAAGAASLDRTIRQLYRDRRRLMAAAGWRLGGWLFGSVEIWLGFFLLGHPIAIGEAVAMESVGQIVRSAGFVIPGGLGVQEGGLMLAGSWLGLAPDQVLAVALLKRARELVYGVFGLWAWSLIEGSRSTGDGGRG